MKTIKISDNADFQLKELSKGRRQNEETIRTKQDIVAELIAKAFSLEVINTNK